MSGDNMHIAQIVFLIVLDIPLFILVGRVFFHDWAGFFEAVWFWFKPDLWSAFDGTYWLDQWNELKVFLFIAICGIMVYSEYYVITHYIAK
jgi:hypothetical protein